MMERIKNWLKQQFSAAGPPKSTDLRHSGAHDLPPPLHPPIPVPRSDRKPVDLDPQVSGTVENAGSGNNVLIRNRYVREDSGTHETLKIIDDSLIDTGEKTGIDPYNTGEFDRSKNWGNRFRN